MGQIKQTTQQAEDALDAILNRFRQDIGDSAHTVGSPQAIVAGTEYRVTNDTLGRNAVISPTYMTDRWDATNNKIAVPSEYDEPMYVLDFGFTFDPASASDGTATLRVYIDDATPKLIKTYRTPFKGPAAEQLNFIATWYFGTEAGYDAKNDGIYFTLEFDAAGDLYDKSMTIYRT